jgi:hypothetical protein
MSDEIPWYSPGHHREGIPRQRKAGAELWRLQNDQGGIVTCELRDDSTRGFFWDVQLLHDGELLLSRRCETEVHARYVAQAFKQDYITAGGREVEQADGG